MDDEPAVGALELIGMDEELDTEGGGEVEGDAADDGGDDADGRDDDEEVCKPPSRQFFCTARGFCRS